MADEHLGESLLVALKATAVPNGVGLTIPVGRPIRAVLRPVSTRKGHLNAADVIRLTDWRNRFGRAFLTEFDATYERTSNWLIEVVGPSHTRVVFMVDDLAGHTVGYMGLACIDWESGSFEIDAIVRGEEASRGLMGEAVRTMIRWARCQLGLGDAQVRVLADNNAREFYRRIGFRDARQVPLRRVEEPGMTRWVEEDAGPVGSRSLIYMLWAGD